VVPPAQTPLSRPSRAVIAGQIVLANVLQQLRILHGTTISRLRSIRGG
jgi:hypothetical protein